ncbi:glycosyltransferase family 39 protein [Streptacidiphilus sp. MAP5-3]|uniref:glycosyltransferase family 39 protein n=1 Tax=unclassified Streptacidiphilus TaxID=2643834 RepID=UPI003510E39F
MTSVRARPVPLSRPADSGPALRRTVGRAAPALVAFAAVRGLGIVLVLGYGWAHGKDPIARLGTLWDAGWYALIVDHGYSRSNGAIGAHGIPYSPRAFFPLYPGLARAVREVTGIDTAGALVAVSWVSSLAAAWAIFAIADRLWSRRVGVIAAVLWGVLPLAAVESMGYSEALFTALCAWSLYALLAERWVSAGVLCALAGLTRPSASALIAAVALTALIRLWRDRPPGLRGLLHLRDGRWRPAAAVVLAPLGWLGYVVYVSLAAHSLDAYFHIQDAWNTGLDWGGSTLHWYARLTADLFGSNASARHWAVGKLPEALTGIGYLVLLVAALCRRGYRRQPLPLLVFGAGMVLVDVVNASPYPPIARFLLPAFTLLYPLAQWLADRRAVAWPFLATAAVASAVYGVSLVYYGGAPA